MSKKNKKTTSGEENSDSLCPELKTNASITRFMKSHICYDLMPMSGKLVTLDKKLVIKRAFYALMDNSIRAAPLWDSIEHEHIGMLTATDLIKIILKFSEMKLVENVNKKWLKAQTIEYWKECIGYKRSFHSISPESTLYEAIEMLIKYKVHRLPITDTETSNVLSIIT
ncbi:hypothetical protein A3Q56_08255, partial [Intoshia linei]